jgi:hypothetical protein
MKSFCAITASKSMSLLRKFSSPAFILANESNHTILFSLLDFFNNCIQYQFDGNNHLVYELLRNKALIENLVKLDFQTLLEQNAKTIEKQKSKLLEHKTSTNTLTADEPDEQEVTPSAEDSETKGKEKVIPGHPAEFTPSIEWFNHWHNVLPLDALLSMIDTLVPQLERLCAENQWNDESVLNYLKSGTLVGLLPVPHPIFTRRFMLTDGIRSWFTSYMWGVLYLRHVPPALPIWLETKIKMFVVKSAE